MPASSTVVKAEDHVATRKVIVNGEELSDDLVNRIAEIRVEQSVGMPDSCTLKIAYPKPEEEGQPHPIDDLDFSLGDALEVHMGETDATAPAPMFKGEVVTLAPVFGAGGVELHVWAYDKIHRLTRRRKSKTWVKKTDAEVVEEIIGKHSLKVNVAPDIPRIRFDHISQHNETDLDFIARRMERIGCEVVADGDTLIVQKAGHGPTHVLAWPGDIWEFAPRVTSTQQVDAVTVRSLHPLTKKEIKVKVDSPDQISQAGISRDKAREKFKGNTIHLASQPVATEDEAKTLATAVLSKIANSYACAEGVGKGNRHITAGAVLEIEGCGEKFSGKYRVNAAVHEQRGGGAFTSRFSSYPVSATMHGSGGNGSAPDFGYGVALAVVTNNNDPDGLGRVKVRYPALDDDNNESDWLRVATPSTGKNRGMMMLPVKDEEVLVAFEHGSRPYVIGSLFNGGKDVAEDLADKKGAFVLRSDDRIDQRSTKDFSVKSEAKMLVDVSSDHQAKVGGNSKIEIKGNEELKITGNHDLKAMQVTIKADGSIKIQSTGPLSIKTGATLDIEGSIVTIKSTGPLTLKGTPIMLN